MRSTDRFRSRGMVAVLAMLYLVLFTTLALGFYASTTTSVQVAGNDQRISRAMMAAESGMDFMRYQLSRVSIPAGTPSSQVVAELFKDLQDQIDGTANIGGGNIARAGNTIYIPANGWIPVDSDGDAGFQITITDWAGEIVVKSQGRSGVDQVVRAVTMDFTRQQKNTTLFNYAVASKGQIVMKKGSVSTTPGVDPLIATMLSSLEASSAIKVSGGAIGGELTVLESASVSVTGGNVAGSSIPSVIMAEHVNYVPDPPEFPTFDPTVYRQYATNTWKSGQKTQSNIIVPAGSGTPNKPVTFNGNDVVQGILYIESPNCVKFNGNFNLMGFIVMETSSSTTDYLDFRGNVTMSPLPSSPQFDALRATSGIAILAPNASVTMSGSADSQVRGSIVCNTFSFAGSADIQIDAGTLMTLKEGSDAAVFAGKTVRFSSTGASNMPTTGVSYSTYFSPNPATYQEVAPAAESDE